MRIVVVNTAASIGGALSILRDFYEYIKKNDKENEWIFLLSDKYIEETENIKIIIKKEPKSNWLKRLKWEILDGAKFINGLNPDVVLSMQNTMNRGILSKKVIYLHQPLPFQKEKIFSFWKSDERYYAIYQHFIGRIIKQSVKSADKIIVQTKWMKNAVIRETKIPQNNIVVIFPAMPETEIKIEKEYLKEKKFFYPASAVSYKNHKCIVDAVKILIEKGIMNFKVEFTLQSEYAQKLDASKFDKQIKFIGNLGREEVFKRYSESVLLFPSYIETFGLPLLEARNIGSFILASDSDFSKEILDKYKNCKFFNPFKPEELANHMENIILGNIKYENLEGRNLENADMDTWKIMIDEILMLGK